MTTAENKIDPHCISMMSKPSRGHRKGMTGPQWEVEAFNLPPLKSGMIPFEIPARHHKKVASDYIEAKRTSSLMKLYARLAKYGRNSGPADTGVVAKVVKGIVLAQGGEV